MPFLNIKNTSRHIVSAFNLRHIDIFPLASLIQSCLLIIEKINDVIIKNQIFSLLYLSINRKSLIKIINFEYKSCYKKLLEN